MRKRLISMVLVSSLFFSIAIPKVVSGEDGTEPSSPDTSSHAATMTGNGITNNTENDDDNLANPSDTDGADINVWAIVKDSSTPTYKIDIAWGNMQFEFNKNSGTWDPDTHTYSEAGTPGWTESYLNGSNNKLDVTNHSDHAITTTLSYAMTPSVFNATSGVSAVIGRFFSTIDDAKAAAQALLDTTTITNNISTFDLDTAAAHDLIGAGERTQSSYFAFSGTPDEGKGADLSSFTKVGVIKVTIVPKA